VPLCANLPDDANIVGVLDGSEDSSSEDDLAAGPNIEGGKKSVTLIVSQPRASGDLRVGLAEVDQLNTCQGKEDRSVRAFQSELSRPSWWKSRNVD
jgi:hypothetical protein